MPILDEEHAFVGVLEFELSLGLFGRRVRRKVRAHYQYTPEWEYLDPSTGRLTQGTESSIVSLSILAVPDLDPTDKPTWIKTEDLVKDGILPHRIWNVLYEKIDARCKEEDARRRARS